MLFFLNFAFFSNLTSSVVLAAILINFIGLKIQSLREKKTSGFTKIVVCLF